MARHRETRNSLDRSKASSADKPVRIFANSHASLTPRFYFLVLFFSNVFLISNGSRTRSLRPRSYRPREDLSSKISRARVPIDSSRYDNGEMTMRKKLIKFNKMMYVRI